jgi:hypothetical protein
VVIIRILRDLCQRVPTWSPLSSWVSLKFKKIFFSTITNLKKKNKHNVQCVIHLCDVIEKKNKFLGTVYETGNFTY